MEDRNGNILSLWRHGLVLDAQGQPRDIDIMDKLSYLYGPLSNQLEAVADESGYLEGFRDKVNAYDYDYDSNGNMKFDKNKGISKIYYNHLNLPTDVVISDNETGTISYIYDATGSKLRKIVDNTTASSITTTEYAGNFIYENETLKFFSHPEGYIEPDGNGNFDYIYQYTDHLGNIRLSYRDASTTSTPLIEIVEENNYYPFGLEHKGYNNLVISTNIALKRAYNGREFEQSLGLNSLEMIFRQYDPSLARFNAIDRLTEFAYGITPYRFGFNNPIIYADPTGLFETRKEARRYRRETGYRGQIKRQEDGSYGLYASNGFHYEAGDDSEYALNDKNPNDGVIQSIALEGKPAQSNNRSFSFNYEQMSMTANVGGTIILGALDERIPRLNASDFYLKNYNPKVGYETIQSHPGKVFEVGTDDAMKAIGNLRAITTVLGHTANAMGYYSAVDSAIKGDYKGATTEGASATAANAAGYLYGWGAGLAWGVGWELGRYISNEEWYNNIFFGKESDVYFRRGMENGWYNSKTENALKGN